MLGLTQVTQGDKVLAKYSSRTALGMAQSLQYGNGIRNTFDYNAATGVLRGLQVSTAFSPVATFRAASVQTMAAAATITQNTASGVLLDLGYTHDTMGNVLSIQDRTPLSNNHQVQMNEAYSYDAIYRLMNATGAYGNQSYQYDAVGNILMKEGVTYTYGDLEHPYAPTAGTSGFQATYDANGNMVTKRDAYGNNFNLIYDEENQLTKVEKNGNYTEEFTYDATGYRVKRKVGPLITDYIYWGNTLLYETTAGKGISYVWSEGKMIAKLEGKHTTYFSHDHLGTSKLQTDENGQVVSSDITKPFGPRSCDQVVKEDFATLTNVNTGKSKITFDEANGIILAPAKGVSQDNLLANNSHFTTNSLEYVTAKVISFRLTEADGDRSIKFRLTHLGKARIRIIGEDNKEYLSKEITTNKERTQNFSCSMSSKPNQLYLVTLEVATYPSGKVYEAKNTDFETSWGELNGSFGELRTRQLTLNQDAYSIRLSWEGSGVSFMASTDNGKSWESVENGVATTLKSPGRKVVLKAVLQMAATTALDGYTLEVNPTQYMLFTGKVLSEEIGLVYFGARWYDPEVGRFITVDPAEDGGNWYALCGNDPINYFDPDGELSLRGWGVLWGGLKVGFNQYALKTAINVATGIAIGSAVAVCMPVIMPTLPASIPIIVAAASYTMLACDIGPDLAFLVKQFSTVFLSKNPSDAKVHAYGVTISKVGLKFAGLLTTSYGMKAIMKTGILEKIGVRLENGIKKVWADETGSVNLGGSNNRGSRTKWGAEHGRNNTKHNNAIESELDWAQNQGADSIRKNMTQMDANGNIVSNRKPDASYVLNGKRYNTNYVSNYQLNNIRELNREINAFNSINDSDPNAITSLIFKY